MMSKVAAIMPLIYGVMVAAGFRLAASITIDAADSCFFGKGNRRIFGAGHVSALVLAVSDADSDAKDAQARMYPCLCAVRGWFRDAARMLCHGFADYFGCKCFFWATSCVNFYSVKLYLGTVLIRTLALFTDVVFIMKISIVTISIVLMLYCYTLPTAALIIS